MIKNYKKSFYNIFFKKNNRIYIYNTLNQSCVELTDDEYTQYKNLQLDNEQCQALESLGIIVKKGVNEKQQYLNISNENLPLFVRILTTTACNAKCHYCYENGAKIYTIDTTLADKIVDRIIYALKCSNYHSLHVQWFGGEPLLNVNIISYISAKVKEFCMLNNYKFFSTIVTNGSLINDDIINLSLNEWNTLKYQITIDGMKREYEDIKKYNFDNGFEIVLNNIKKLAQNNINVSIRLNYSQDNYVSICKLIKFLKNQFGNNDKIKVYAFRIFENENNKHTQNDIKIDKIVYKCLIKNGFYDALNNFTTTIKDNCVAVRKNNMVINANGDILKCSRAINDNFSVVGNIDSLEYNTSNLDIWENNELAPECKKCKFLTICGGGCKYDKIKGNEHCPLSPKLIKFLLKQSL